MDDNVTVRLIELVPRIVRAGNIEGALDVIVNQEGSVKANLIFRHWAHLSIELLSDESLINAKDLKVTLESRVTTGDTDLWSALVGEHSDWHPPLHLAKLDQNWQRVEIRFKDYLSLTNSFRVLKFIVRNNCEIEVRDVQLHGVSGIDSLKLIIPWFGRDTARIRARDIAISRLADQDLTFELTLLELLYNNKPPTFTPKQKNHFHITIQKDQRYAGIFHKEALFEYYLRTHRVQPFSAYVFMDSDIFSYNESWLSRIADRLSQSLREGRTLLLQPYNRIIDTDSGIANYSFCRAEQDGLDTLSINPGLCWATTGKTLIDRDIHFPHKLVTGIADAVFASSYTKQSDRIPYLPPFSVSALVPDNQCDWDFIDEDLNHVNHGRELPDSYAMRDLLWQAVLDHNVLENRKPVLEDSDGFHYFPHQNSRCQIALTHLMNLETPDSVLAQVFRNYGAPMNHIQHITRGSGESIPIDPRGLTLDVRILWECARSYFRFYALGVEKTTVVEQCYHDYGSFSDNSPILREMVNERANHPIILLTATGCVAYPSMLVAINQHLDNDDIIFFSAIPQTYANSRASAIAIASPPLKTESDSESAKIAAIAFTRAWWLENHMMLPHGLLAEGNFLDCFFQLVQQNWPRIKVLPNHCRIITGGKANQSVEQHNTRVTESIAKLHNRGFLSIGPINADRRKIKIERINTNHNHPNAASVVNAIEILETTNGILFSPCVNSAFFCKNNIEKPYMEKWCGIIHGTFNYAKHLPPSELNLNQLLQNKGFQDSLDDCAGLFTHTKYLRQCLQSNEYWNHNVSIEVLPFTTDEPKRGFRADWFWGEGKSNLYCIGSTKNRLKSFFELNEGDFNKILLTPSSLSSEFQQYLQAEKNDTHRNNSVTLRIRPPADAYDDILSRNPVFIDYYDLDTDAVLYEGIVRNTPMILRRHPAAEEILGSEYPLFYSKLSQASAMLNETRILEGHLYLANLHKQRYYHLALTQALEKSEIYQCL